MNAPPSPPADVLDSRPPRLPLVGAGGVDILDADMTATFAADVPLDVAERALADRGLYLPVDPSDADPSTPLGRLVERNATGPLRLGYGAWRDLLLGVQFTNGSGQLITAGGRTVKNVAGYDLTKLMVGQCGLLGRIVTLTTRVYRLPDSTLRALFLPRPAVVASLVNRLLPTPCRPQWVMAAGAGSWVEHVACGYHGSPRAVDYLEGLLPAFGPAAVVRGDVAADAQYRRRHWRGGGEGGPMFRASVPPARVLEFVSLAGSRRWAADLAFGIVVGPGEAVDSIRRAARAVGGTACVFGAGNDGPLLWLNADERRIVQSLKQAFDPAGRLAPLPPEPPERPTP